MAVPFAIMFTYGYVFENVYIMVMFGIMLLAFLPGIFSIVLAPGITIKFIKLHKRFQRKTDYRYFFIENKIPAPLSIKFAFVNSLYTISIMYSFLNWTGSMNMSQEVSSLIGMMIVITMPSLLIGSVLHISSVLLKYTGLMFENKKEETTIKVGAEFNSKLQWVLSPILVISLVHSALVNDLDLPFFLGAVFAILVIGIFSSFVSFYVLKKKHIEKMKEGI